MRRARAVEKRGRLIDEGRTRARQRYGVVDSWCRRDGSRPTDAMLVADRIVLSALSRSDQSYLRMHIDRKAVQRVVLRPQRIGIVVVEHRIVGVLHDSSVHL